jgi:hypothetical protein
MGALRGAISVRRYAVLDPLPDDVRRKFVRGIRAHAFLPLDPKAEADRAVGWVSIIDGDDAELTTDKLFFVGQDGEQLRLTMRIDVLKPPAGEVRRQVEARAAEIEAAEKRPLSRREKRMLKEEVARTLRLRTIPRVRLTDVIWDLDERRLYLFSQVRSVCETFVDLFAKSFALKIDVEGPAAFARTSLGKKAAGALEPTEALAFGFPELRPIAQAPIEDEG